MVGESPKSQIFASLRARVASRCSHFAHDASHIASHQSETAHKVVSSAVCHFALVLRGHPGLLAENRSQTDFIAAEKDGLPARSCALTFLAVLLEVSTRVTCSSASF